MRFSILPLFNCLDMWLFNNSNKIFKGIKINNHPPKSKTLNVTSTILPTQTHTIIHQMSNIHELCSEIESNDPAVDEVIFFGRLCNNVKLQKSHVFMLIID